MKKRNRRKKRTGVSRRSLFILALAPALRAQGQDFAIIAGTVFREPGFALPRAQITVELLSQKDGEKKPKPIRAQSDSRGEFALRVPPAQATYRVSVAAEGFQPQSSETAVSPGVRSEVNFVLKPIPR